MRKGKMDSNQALDMALSQIDKQFGKGSIMKLGDRGHVGVASISTGALSLDIALGIGGLPRGRVIEMYGPESSGKSTLATQRWNMCIHRCRARTRPCICRKNWYQC